MFTVNIKNTRGNTSGVVYFTSFSSVSIVDVDK